MTVATTADTLTLTEILEITLNNGVIGYFTNHNTSLTYATNHYFSVPFQRTPISYHTDLQVDKVTLDIGIVSVTVGTHKYTIPQIIRRGFLRGARVKLSIIDYTSLATTALTIFEGIVNDDIQYNAGVLTLSVSSILDILDSTFPKICYSEFCQHTLWSTYCGLTKVTYKHTDTATAGTTTSTIYAAVFAAAVHALGYWVKGEIMFTLGNNTDIKRTIRTHSEGYVTLVVPYHESIVAATDTFDVYPGCDKQIGTCETKFSATPGNTANFFGFPNIPKQQDLVFA
jgi:uncharacterized phage protein (TIGR02218 family)